MSPRSSAAVWSAVHDERQALITDLESLTPQQWATPSLCPGWDVHDVLAHLVDGATTTRLGFAHRLISAGFDFDRDNARGVAKERRSSPAGTLAEFQRVRTATATPPAALATRLVEAIVHGEDIRRPLGIVRSYPCDRIATALRYQLKTTVSMGGGKERAAGLHLCGVDSEIDHGSGADVQGSTLALLMAVSGRPVDAGSFTGDGAHELAQRSAGTTG